MAAGPELFTYAVPQGSLQQLEVEYYSTYMGKGPKTLVSLFQHFRRLYHMNPLRHEVGACLAQVASQPTYTASSLSFNSIENRVAQDEDRLSVHHDA